MPRTMKKDSLIGPSLLFVATVLIILEGGLGKVIMEAIDSGKNEQLKEPAGEAYQILSVFSTR